LKGVGPTVYHLGCNFFHDEDGTLCYGPHKYIDKMMENYKKIFGSKPKERGSPLEQNDHPELDESPLLDAEGISLYQSLIGAAQWVVLLGRYDIMTALATMSQFWIAPRQGHLERLKQIYGSLRRFKTASIRVEVDPPDYSHMKQLQHDWSYSVYGDVEELVPKDVPEPLGKPVILSHYCDANLNHDLITGRAVTGILHFVNSMVIDWYSKKQATVETATYGTEFVAARIAIDQIIDLRLFLRNMGIPIVGIYDFRALLIVHFQKPKLVI
jgi:hypothetical protein